ncbi:MotA/TolQ/ExbB proton channel family protein [Burkholderia semiarida]|uniref:hypothetical protein n=1 Tax=Burkholderia semiarida TaxID=2843303 RepID=UPI0023DD6C2F|nr:hypothetical protein [Burkholderia semiarida]MDF3116327.1 MotA/TolQ/ExbB proton channel family protein [Burkholderia semiarida]
MWRLKWLRGYIDTQYGRELRQAERENASLAAQESIEQNWLYELSFISEEEDEIFTRRTMREARVLRISVAYEKDDWETTSTSGRRVLSDTGTARYREKIRDELRWRQERRAHWVSMLTSVLAPFIGVIGAITGLVAVFIKAKGG